MTHNGNVDWLGDIRSYSAYMLAEMAGVHSPNSSNSEGAQVLTELRDEILDAWERGHTFDLDSDRDDRDHALRLASETLSDYTHPVMVAFVDLCAYRESNEQSMNGTWSGTFEDMVREALGQVCERLAVLLVEEVRKAWDGLECSDCEGPWADCRDGCVGKDCGLCGSDGGECFDTCQYQDGEYAPDSAQNGSEAQAAAQATEPAGEAVTEADKALWAASLAQTQAEMGPQLEGPTETFIRRMQAINAEEFGRWARIRAWLIRKAGN